MKSTIQIKICLYLQCTFLYFQSLCSLDLHSVLSCTCLLEDKYSENAEWNKTDSVRGFLQSLHILQWHSYKYKYKYSYKYNYKYSYKYKYSENGEWNKTDFLQLSWFTFYNSIHSSEINFAFTL